MSEVNDDKLTGVNGVSTGWRRSGDFMFMICDSEGMENGGGDFGVVFPSLPESCVPLGDDSFMMNWSVLKFERNGNWFIASGRLLKLLNPLTPLKLFKELPNPILPPLEFNPFGSVSDNSVICGVSEIDKKLP